MAKVRTADKWVRSKADELAIDRGCYFDLKAAERVRTFFSSFLRHSKGQFAGKKFELLDWQWNDLIAPLFGWKRADGTRRFRRAGVWIPKKNGKSTLCSGISLYLLIADNEPGAEVYSAAADRSQASIVFNEAASMVAKSPALSSRLEVIRSQKTIYHHLADAKFQALSADVPTKEGLNIHGLIFDEIHAQKSRKLFDTLRYGTAARRQPLLITISTAGHDRDSIGYEQYTYAKGVLEGTIEDFEFFPFIREAAPEDDWTAEETWKKANPSYGITIPADNFRVMCEEAKQSPANENVFRRYRLNQWTEQETRWISVDTWNASGKQSNLAPSDLEGKRCYGGLDLASTLDLNAFSLYFPDEFAVLCWFWAPEEIAKERERTNRQRFDDWIRRGFIKKTPGRVADYDVIREDVLRLADIFNIKDIGVDRWNATQLATQLQGEGLKVFGFGQGFASMSAPSKEFEKLVVGGQLVHFDNPVLRWMVGNVAVEKDAAGNVKPSRDKSTEKIDGVVATIMAIGRSMLDDEPKPKVSVYESRGVFVL